MATRWADRTRMNVDETHEQLPSPVLPDDTRQEMDDTFGALQGGVKR